jgi:hypothetical protein
MIGFDRIETDGAALMLGFALVLSLLYRNPVSGMDAIMADPASILYFGILPVVGLLSGGYAAFDGPYSAVLVLALGSYLGVFGLALTVGTLLSPPPVGIITGVGIVLLVLAVVALVTSLLHVAASVRFGTLGVPTE